MEAQPVGSRPRWSPLSRRAVAPRLSRRSACRAHQRMSGEAEVRDREWDAEDRCWWSIGDGRPGRALPDDQRPVLSAAHLVP